MKNCSNCKYEPAWSPMSTGEYPRQFGVCEWDKNIPALPQVFRLRREGITRYQDGSGVMGNCKTWAKK